MTVIQHPINTEKAIRMMEAENKLVFMVDRRATKGQIKHQIEREFNVKIVRVNTLISFKGKKAVVTLDPETPAIDVATKLGLM